MPKASNYREEASKVARFFSKLALSLDIDNAAKRAAYEELLSRALINWYKDGYSRRVQEGRKQPTETASL